MTILYLSFIAFQKYYTSPVCSVGGSLVVINFQLDLNPSLLTRKMYAQRVASFIGSYYVQLGHVDGIVFTAGLGENDAAVRSEICALLTEALGVKLDEEFNKTIHGKEALISAHDSKIQVWVIPTNEELVIARDTVRLLHLK